MVHMRRLVTAAVVAVLITGMSVPATHSEANAAPVHEAGSAPATCAFASSLAVLLDGESTPRGFDPATGHLTSAPKPSAGTCEAAATPDDDFGTKTFISSAPSYSKTDANSTFNAQTNFVPGLPTAFSFQVSPALVAVATGAVSAATAARTPSNCSYNKPGVPVDYFFHWSCSKQTADVDYRFDGTWTFPISVGGQSGTATIRWKFDYIIRTRIG
jgi:hypothetical protein